MDTIFGTVLQYLAQWLIATSEWFDTWDTTILVASIIVIAVIMGITRQLAHSPILWQQILWGCAAAALGLVIAAIIWTLVARYLPVADLGTLVRNMLQHQPLTTAQK